MVEYLSLDEIKQEELKILIYFDQFCKDHNLQYSLVGGTLLGAVRHKGFIPWDDDIDVCMPRPDYERFLKIFRGKGPISIEGYGKSDISRYPLVKLVNNNISVHETSTGEILKLWVDIMPIDALPNGDISFKYAVVGILRRIYMSAMTNNSTSASRCIAYKIVKKIYKSILHIVRADKICALLLNKISTMYKYGTTDYVGEIVWGLYGTGERISFKGFSKQVTVVFEGIAFRAMSNYEEYLTGVYGDYMQLPPENKRRNHQLIAWYTN